MTHTAQKLTSKTISGNFKKADSFIYAKIVCLFLISFLFVVIFNFMYAFQVAEIAQLMLDVHLRTGIPIKEEVYAHIVNMEKSTLFSSRHFLMITGLLALSALIFYSEKPYKLVVRKPIHIGVALLLMASLLISGLGISNYSNTSILEKSQVSTSK